MVFGQLMKLTTCADLRSHKTRRADESVPAIFPQSSAVVGDEGAHTKIRNLYRSFLTQENITRLKKRKTQIHKQLNQ